MIETLTARIASGALAPGAMLASEPDLARDFGVSPGTVRKALGALEGRGLVTRQQGRGTFVTVRTPESALFHFFRLHGLDGVRSDPVLEREHVTARTARPAETAALFDAPARVVEIVRVRSVAGTRALYERAVVPAALFPGLAERAPLPNTLYALYQRAYSCAIVRAEDSLHAGGATPEVAAALDLTEGAPVLISERRAVDLLERVVELRTSHYRTDALRYRVDLT
ncbi:MAG: GntR family transcriptional regulator [Pseudomonadota bacterium]